MRRRKWVVGGPCAPPKHVCQVVWVLCTETNYETTVSECVCVLFPFEDSDFIPPIKTWRKEGRWAGRVLRARARVLPRLPAASCCPSSVAVPAAAPAAQDINNVGTSPHFMSAPPRAGHTFLFTQCARRALRERAQCSARSSSSTATGPPGFAPPSLPRVGFEAMR